MKFYFTYGTEDQPFHGGWTEIEAPDIHAAYAAFRAYHPDKIEGLLDCSDIYTEERFQQTEMYRHGNFGCRCHEIMALIAPPNDPLTLDELRQMDGEPVWVELRQDGTIEMQGWALVEVEIEDVAATNFRLDFETYGEDGWIAYRRKP